MHGMNTSSKDLFVVNGEGGGLEQVKKKKKSMNKPRKDGKTKTYQGGEK